MKRKFVIVSVFLAFVAGAIIGGASGALFVSQKVVRYETDAIAMAVAESTFSVVPAVVALESDDQEAQLELFESAARARLNAGISTLHASIKLLNEDKRSYIEGVLKSIARNRDKLSLGQYDDPPKQHIENILAQYSE
jgi:ribosome assembly protein YihI (activator of Der GTPase)